jgi:hypothetical protein
LRACLRVNLAVLLGAVSLGVAEARADTPVTLHEASPTRSQVVLGTIGLAAGPARQSVSALLGVELARNGLSLVESEPVEPLSAWAAQATRSKRVLAVLLLDARGEQGWRLIVIDAARGRAIARELPGGYSHDAASVEAVVSIAGSAANALREGLEVASAPLAAVVAPPSAPSIASAPPPPARRELVPAQPSKSWSPRAFAGASVASFSQAAPATAGVSLAVSATSRARVEGRLIGSLFAPAQVQSPLGQFRVARAFIGASAGPVLATRALYFTPEAGVLVERLRRFEAAPAAGVAATEAGALYRAGGLLSLRLRHALHGSLSAEVVAGAVYFGRRVRFSAQSPERSWSADAWPALAFAQLGLGLALD